MRSRVADLGHVLVRAAMSVALALAIVPASSAASEEFSGTPAEAIARVDCEVSVGSAVHLGDGWYATARHVVDPANRCKVGNHGITVTYSDERTDFAIFYGEALSARAKWSCEPFRPGQFYFAGGYANGWETIIEEPWIASGQIRGGWATFTGLAIPGMSGGPVADSNGIVHGVVNMRWPARSMPLSATPLCRTKHWRPW